MLNLPISRDGFIWGLSIASQIHHVPLAATLVMQKYQPPFTLASFRIAAEQCGFKVRQKAVPNSQLNKLPLPCLITLIPTAEEMATAAHDEESGSNRVREYHMALLQKVDDQSVVFAETCSKLEITLSRSEFEKRFAGEVLIVTPIMADDAETTNATKGNSVDGKKGSMKFGMAWFAPHSGWFKSMFRGSR